MKKNLKTTILYSAMSLVTSISSGCLEEAFPEDGTFTEEQVEDADKAAFGRAMSSYFTVSDGQPWDIGYGTFLTWRDAMTADFPVNDRTWDYYHYYNLQIALGNTYSSGIWWDRAYYHISRANKTLSVCSEDPESEEAIFRGYAYTLRALLYFDMAREFEYKHTDVEALDRAADRRGIWGLTVPIITETTTEAESRKTPRAPFYEMYRFIYSDLNNALKYLQEYHTVPTKDMPSLGVAYGMLARFWLELGSRFERHPEDLAKQIENESNSDLEKYLKLEITTANDCYRKAAESARSAISEGYTPTSKSQWFDKSTGFNTPINSWMWAIIITPESSFAKDYTWNSWTSYHAPETEYGMGDAKEWKAYRCIDARLYSEIDENDWRRDTWIDPEFAAMEDSKEKMEIFNERFAQVTSYSYDDFIKYNAYAGFKFRPGSGNGSASNVGNAVSIPLMRVEEMYLIEAEALAYCNGPAAGKSALETFMNSYRMNEGTTYSTNAVQLEDVINEIWTQKRIELWGEGQVWFDYKRRELPIMRGYEGTNHPKDYRYNSNPEAVAPWTNFYIVDRVHDLNQTVILNPDPTGAIKSLWVEE